MQRGSLRYHSATLQRCNVVASALASPPPSPLPNPCGRLGWVGWLVWWLGCAFPSPPCGWLWLVGFVGLVGWLCLGLLGWCSCLVLRCCVAVCLTTLQRCKVVFVIAALRRCCGPDSPAALKRCSVAHCGCNLAAGCVTATLRRYGPANNAAVL